MAMNINKRLHEHALYAFNTYKKDWFVLCLQGSQNYGLATEKSDIDSKMLILPSFKDLVLNTKPISHTLEMPDNKEHVDIKDAREYFKIFKKSNINFVEILFTDYWMVNHKYNDLWLELRLHREELARINPYAAVKCMKGMAYEKRHALCHEYPSKLEILKKFGYDPKQLSHLIRIYYFVNWYIEGVPYKDCICPKDESIREELLNCKRNGLGLTKEQAEKWADEVVEKIDKIANNFCSININKNDPKADELLNDILFELIKRSIDIK